MITFDEKTKTFRLETNSSLYALTITKRGHIAHTWYGAKLGTDDISCFTRQYEYGYNDNPVFREKLNYLDMLPMEYPTEGIGDFRESALSVLNEQNRNAIELKYKSYKIINGTLDIPDLPCVFSNQKDSQTLELITFDEVLNVEVSLYYTIFNDTDAIVRWQKIHNHNSSPITIKRALSLSFDMDNNDYDIITLHGSWARERHIERRPLHLGIQSVESLRGVSSHQEHPFLAILDHNADYQTGNVYGINFIYSGNFLGQVQNNQFNNLRIQIGISPQCFSWTLQQDECFYTPQAVLTFSSNGINKMSQSFHELYKNHLIRSSYKDKMRPILINNWEATYFDFNTEKLLDIARDAKDNGIEMLVMDDGWFGKRNCDDTSLGDWFVNTEKLQGGLEYLVSQVNKIGLKFGIWFEPEMVCPKSELYKNHPDWAIQIPSREASLSREQLVLDITRDEVRDYIYNSIKSILQSANIEYVKWDMNRALSDISSINLSKEEIGQFYHRYVIAMYKMQNQLIKDFPNLLLENCSSGGGRFDPGMLYYSPQIWTSDDTDAIERLSIQEGTAIIYPLSTIGAHVSVCPNHALGRNTPFKTRGYVALSGTFGYELDITKLSKEDKSLIPVQIDLYKKFNPIIREGDYYRIASYQENNEFDCWMSVLKDKSKALLTFVQVLNKVNYKSRIIKLQGLDENAMYKVSYPDEDQNKFTPYIASGKTLMNAGIMIARDFGDFQAKLVYLEKNLV